jgi:hypothetical protein
MTITQSPVISSALDGASTATEYGVDMVGLNRIGTVEPDAEHSAEPRRSGPAIWRFCRAVVDRVRTEWMLITDLPVQRLRTRQWRAIPVTIACTALTFTFWVASNYSIGMRVMMDVAGVIHSLPLWLQMVRLPLSLFAPAPDLPVWGALAQMFLVFLLAEIWLGPWRMLLVATFVNAVTTLAGSLMVSIGLYYSIGTPQVDAYQLDTGPSVAVVSLAVYIGLRCRAYLAGSLVVITMIGEAVLVPNLAGREHLVGCALGFVSYGLWEHAFPYLRQRWHTRGRPDTEPAVVADAALSGESVKPDADAAS